MPSDRKSRLIHPLGVAVVVLLGLYVGAYYATVRPFEASASMTCFIPTGIYVPRYPSPILERLFEPIHWFDVRARPRVWGPR